MAFSWINFDTSFLISMIMASDLPDEVKADVQESSEDKDYVVSKMNRICATPDKAFIMKYRPMIEQGLLKYYKNEVEKICKTMNIQGETHEERQKKLAKRATSASLIQAYIDALLSISGMDVEMNEFSKFRNTVSVNMAETVIEEVPLYDFQKDAIEELKKYFIKEDKDSGIMVMPTGSGKSRTSITFLVREMVSQGYQILWIAHRHMLLDQAADCFYKFAGLAKINNPDIHDYRISCISGEHMSIKMVDQPEIIVASISSICRNKPHLNRVLREKVMIVVDECHHTLAPTYRDTIEFIRNNRSGVKLLGVTATPVRATSKDSKRLMQLFDNHVIYDVSMANLIAKGILADPEFKRIETGEDFEPEITIDEGKMIQRYGELPESLVNKIAMSNSRNELIINEYLDNAEKYGKTLIFALNIIHCRFLFEELTKRGVKCGLVYSGKDDNSRVIEQFKDGTLDVLINVNIMTEGTDVPDIQTVFLTRPIGSEGLLMQMIGRGMRGRHAGGTETVNIVDFHDKWDTFNRWMNPEWLISKEQLEYKDPKKVPKTKPMEYDWNMCQDIYRSMRFKAEAAGSMLSLPVGWFTLVDEEGELTRMIVFEDQLPGITEMRETMKSWVNDKSATPKRLLERFFGGFCSAPALRDMELLVDNYRTLESPPEFHEFTERKVADPYYVVEQAEKDGQDLFMVGSKLFDENAVVRDLYGSKEQYIMELCKMKLYKGKAPVLGLSVQELPEEQIPFDRTPYHNLNELTEEVIDEMLGGRHDRYGSVEWTDRAYRTYYGVHNAADHSVKINSVLNSKDVPKEVVKFVIYHELLHRDNRLHDEEFRKEERKFPGYEECEHFLYDNMKKFDIVEW